MRPMERQTVKLIQKRILGWYRKHKRELQWRTTSNPFEILVSEIMLQQTQVNRVQEKLPVFLKRFPTVRTLASASTGDVIHAWRGMGYNSRAVRLREMARMVIREYRGTIPANTGELENLPGIGPYTAHAVACFAFHQHVPVVDVNIRRILSRLFAKMKRPDEVIAENEAWNIASNVLPGDAYAWNQALMDIGSIICTAKKPSCIVCPVQDCCASRHLGDGVHRTPMKDAKKKNEPSYEGIPRRIWRGRIVDALRAVDPAKSVSLMKLGKVVKPGFVKHELPWLRDLITKLESDGIVDCSRTLVRLSTK